MAWLSRHQARLHIQLSVWAQLGVLARIMLNRLLGAACSAPGEWDWAPCVTSDGITRSGGALFLDLPANILGCFIIGLLAPCDVLSAVLHQRFSSRNLAGLPAACWAQQHLPLQVGLRTGFCGALTTFASWQLQMVVMAVGGGSGTRLGMRWVDSLSGLLLGSLCAFSALVLGQHTAAALHLWCGGLVAAEGGSADKGMTQQDGENAGGQQGKSGKVPAAEQQGQQLGAASSSTAAQAAALWQAAQQEEGSQKAAQAVVVQELLPAGGCSCSCAEPLVDAAVLAAGCAITAGSLVGAVQGDGSPYQYIWISLLLAPLGCFARYHLAALNYSVQQHGLSWLPAGTLAANLLACLCDYAAKLLLHRLPGLGQPGSSLLQALVIGFGGALSTVSTWALEIQKLLDGFPQHSRAYSYYFITVATAYLLGLLVYGVGVWTL